MIDRWDITAAAGVALIAMALWQIEPLAAQLWVGAVLVLVGVMGARR